MDPNFLEYLKTEREKVNKHIVKLFNDIIAVEDEPLLRKFFKTNLEFVLGGGRRLLPIATINTFKGLSSDHDITEYLDEIYRISMATEMLHIGALIHDDFIDREDVRSGHPTFHKLLVESFNKERISDFENPVAIYGGTLTSFYGAQIIANSRFSEDRKNRALIVYNEGMNRNIRGHLLETFYSSRPLDEISVENYLILAECKRGTQMQTAVAIGAIFGNARQSQLDPLMQAMNKVGIIDQITNDIRGSFGDSSQKSIDNDIKHGQRTILTIIANQNATPVQKKVLKEILGKINATTAEVEQVRKIFRETRAVDFAKQYAQNLKTEMEHSLAQVYPGLRKENEEFFSLIADYLLE